MWRAGAIRITRLGGISIDVHLTLALAIAGGGWAGWTLFGGLSGAAYGVLAFLLLFVCLLLHELAHGVLAHKLGLAVSRITFLPIGILLEIPPASPRQEVLIALAGPLANLGAGLVFGLFAYRAMPLSTLSFTGLMKTLLVPNPNGILFFLMAVNMLLATFNMLPAFPMDGGRVLRAGLALAVDYVLATRIAAWLGRGLAIVMGLVSISGLLIAGIPFDPALAIVAVIVFLGAHREELYVRQQRALVHMEVKDVYQSTPETLSPWDNVTRRLAVQLLKHEQALPVVIENRVVGLVTYQEIDKSFKQDNPVTIAHIMRTNFPTLQLHETLWAALRTMSASQLARLPVVHQGVFQGVVDLDDIEHAWRLFRPGKKGNDRPPVSGDVPQ